MARRFLALAFAFLMLGTALVPASAFAFGSVDTHLDCCCPDPSMCPVVNGRHACEWKRAKAAGEIPPDDTRPQLRSCASGETVLELAESQTWLPPAFFAIAPQPEFRGGWHALAAPPARMADAPETPPPRA